MKAFAIDSYGDNERVHAADLPEPVLGRHDVLLQVQAAGVNPLDLKIRDGAFKAFMTFSLPLVLGNDVAGIVVRAGEKARRFQPGDAVFARTDTMRMGGFAERVAIHEDAVASKPRTLSMERAAAVPLVALTAWQALVETAKLKAGQKVLILAGSGGVGTMAIQLAKHLGAFVATTASAAGTDLVTRLGADLVIDYKHEDFSKTLTDYDVVLDTQGGHALDKALGSLRREGIVVGLAGPPTAGLAEAVGAGILFKLVFSALSFTTRRKAKKLGVTYAFLFMQPEGRQLGEIGALIDAGTLEPVVDRVFPFAQTKEALAYVETGRAKGKVVVTLA